MNGQMSFDGDTFDPRRDTVRLSKQWWVVWKATRTGGPWHTLASLSARTGAPEASVSARLRDFRKDRFGAHTVERRYVENGLWEYRVLANPHVSMIEGTEDK